MKKALLICGLFLSVVGARADDLAQQVVGLWSKQGDASQTIEFYGAGIGKDAAYFHYEFPAADQVMFNHGGGTTETYTITIADNELHLTDSESNETIYDASAGITNACISNLSQLVGAKSLFGIDHNGEGAAFISQLFPAYITELPVCPAGGIYQLNDMDHVPTCSVLEHRIE